MGKPMTMAIDPTGHLKTDEEAIKELREKTIEWWDKFNKRYVKDYPYPSMTFKIRGVMAGTAHYQSQTIDYNLELYKKYREDTLYDTIPHEIAHLFNYLMYMAPNEHRKWRVHLKPHGKEWVRIMLVMGIKPNRCHNYEVKKVRIVPRPYLYKCSCREFHITENVHKKMQKGDVRWCLKCKVDLVYKGLVKDKVPLDKEEINKKLEAMKKELALLEA